MNSMIKTLVSRNKRRFQEDGFDLDLTYIYPNIIAMGFPAEKLEGVYRNHVDDVLRFLDSKHKDHYRVYNLCSERKYDGSKFHNRVVVFPFDDHHPPPIELIKPFCEDLDIWLTKDPNNIAAIHCKAGKGRTGVMICAYLLHRKKFLDAEKCLEYYGKTRTRDGKGVTIPSQRRYVRYYGDLIQFKKNYEKTTLLLTGVKFHSIPHLNSGSCNVIFDVFCSDVKLGQSPLFESSQNKEKDKDREFRMDLPKPIIVCGDICVDFFNKPPRIGKKERIFQCWFNTFFVQQDGIHKAGLQNGQQKPRYLTVEMTKQELDKANKDKDNKIYKTDFKVVFSFETVCDEQDSNGSVSTVNRSRTTDTICSRPVRNGTAPTGKYAQTHRFNIDSLSGPFNTTSSVRPGMDVTAQVQGLHVSGTRDVSGSDVLPATRHAGIPQSQSETKFDKKLTGGGGWLDVEKRQNVNKSSSSSRQGRLSPSADRRGNMLLPVDSENSLVNFDATSQGEGENEDFSDTDTDDEWEGCEVSAV